MSVNKAFIRLLYFRKVASDGPGGSLKPWMMWNVLIVYVQIDMHLKTYCTHTCTHRNAMKHAYLYFNELRLWLL